MEGRTVTSWRDLMLLQLGTLLRNRTVNQNRRLYQMGATPDQGGDGHA